MTFLRSHLPRTAERRLAQPDNAIAFVLTVPDENLCNRRAFLTAARVLTVARCVAYIVCVCVCARARVRVCVCVI